jgi:TATA-binding protein-associated factor
VPTFHAGVWPKLTETFPMIKLALQSRFAIIRQSAAKCLATICEVMTTEAMRFVVEDIVPLLGDPLVLTNRLGATELIYREC